MRALASAALRNTGNSIRHFSTSHQPFSAAKIGQQVHLFGRHPVFQSVIGEESFFVKSPTFMDSHLEIMRHRDPSIASMYSMEELRKLHALTPEKQKFQAEREAFMSTLMNHFAPGLVPEEVGVLFDENKKQYWVKSKEIKDYVALIDIHIPYDKSRFFIGEKGETRMVIRTSPKQIDVAIRGDITLLIALNAVRESDNNKENIGVVIPKEVLEGKEPAGDRIFPLVSIDHELAMHGQCNFDKEELFELGIKIASGNSCCVFDELQENPNGPSTRKELLKSAVTRVSGVFTSPSVISGLFDTGFSKGYSAEHQSAINQLATDLKKKGTTFILANDLIDNSWDGTEKAADEIFKKKYGADYKNLGYEKVWEIHCKAAEIENKPYISTPDTNLSVAGKQAAESLKAAQASKIL